MNWIKLMDQFNSLPKGAIRLKPPCEQTRIAEIEAALGMLPAGISEMLRCFNGGEFFVDGMPFVTLFGLSYPSDSPTFDWFIDRYTRAWRSKMNRPRDWVVAITNYGGLTVIDESGLARTWDTATNSWQDGEKSYEEWLTGVLSEGEEFFLESHPNK